ncbi:hypothetical protein TWF788_003243 [Orbilia oligospora]|uniref:Uncharacterized protein n=1 Tax=Orbilia oligospora TaxID=2813651 RepID=A0A7C8U130_ORBOL|nr:hypothetical protein TWF788_003243 [Orbilia oligospora]
MAEIQFLGERHAGRRIWNSPQKRAFDAIDTISNCQGSTADSLKSARYELERYMYVEILDVYHQRYAEPYIQGKTKIPSDLLEQFATSFIDDYIEDRCSDMEESWTNIRNPFALKRRLKKSYRSMMVLFAEIAQFKASVLGMALTL